MATTYTALTAIPKGVVFGNKRVTFGTVTVNDTSGSSLCGLNKVEFAVVTPQTITSGYHHNLNTTSMCVNIFSATSADKFNVVAFGR
jgi:hypothetical protein